jgi:signal transduction histidine kinase
MLASSMFAIDVATVSAFTTMLSAWLGGLLIWLWQKDRGQPALASWGAARLLSAAAMPLLGARGFLPQWLSINLADALICLSYGLTWCGARQFESRPFKPAATCAGAVVWLLACEIPAFYGSLEARIALIAVIVSLYNLAAAREFHRGQKICPLPSRPIVVVLLASVAMTVILSGTLPLLFPFRQPSTTLPTTMWFGLLISLNIGMMAAASILLVALTKERAELRSTTALAAARDLANEASSQKTRFLARMSHELRTPLNGVLGLAQVLAADPELGEHQRQHAATLEQAGRHLLDILNEVLDLSRIEAGRMDLSPQPIALEGFLRELAALAQGAAGPLGVAMRLDIAPDLPATVLTDPMRLRQILLNLLNNAWKFTPAGGSVTLNVMRVGGDRVSFSITDTGPGVPASLRPRLFQDYTQALGHSAAGGTGLGLAISARLASAMGGELTHADGPGGSGSCFTLVMPLPEVERPPPAPPRPPAAEPLPPPRGLRFLVVDDVAMNRKTARALLEHAGHVVDVAEDGHAALAALDKGPLPDIILMDQSMPGIDGNTTARYIRNLPGPAGRLPILAVTANAQPEDIEASLAAGMDGHIAKPIELKMLLAAAAKALDREAVHS